MNSYTLSLQSKQSAFMARVARWPFGSLWVFGLKQAWAALFGGLMLIALVATAYVDLPWLSRYDWLFIIALGIQAFMLAAKLEKPYEAITIVLFHLVGLGMELFKTSGSIGSWTYPGEAVFMVGNAPLFSGFMYAAVGSYMARSWRVFGLRFANYPNRALTVLLATAIYLNFFTHHFVYDIRYILFAAIIILYYKTTVTFVVNKTMRHMPLLLAFVLIAAFIWLAENIGTYTSVWLYPDQVEQWRMVSPQKFGSWLLLMVVSFVMVEIVEWWRYKNAPVRANTSDISHKSRPSSGS